MKALYQTYGVLSTNLAVKCYVIRAVFTILFLN